MNSQLQTDWPSQCQRLANQLNPDWPSIFGSYQVDYYWSVYQSEWATDLLFRSRRCLKQLYPGLIRQAIVTFDSSDVLRFLGKRLQCFSGQTDSSYQRRPEGLRIKHRVKANSIKMYDKAGQILRVETTINNSRDFRVYRRAEGKPQSPRTWRPMRKGVADLYARCRFSQSCNERYLQALADLKISQPIQALFAHLTRSTRWSKARFRGLRPWCAQDQALIQAISQPEYHLKGFRNRDLLRTLYGPNLPTSKQKALASRITYCIRLLRAHRLIKKIPRTHAYRLSRKGRQLLPPLIQIYHMDLQQLSEIAA